MGDESETKLGAVAAKLDARLASYAVMQREQQGLALGLENGEGFDGSRHGVLVIPPSRRSSSTDSNGPRQRRKRASAN
jgi:hypothetical protein